MTGVLKCWRWGSSYSFEGTDRSNLNQPANKTSLKSKIFSEAQRVPALQQRHIGLEFMDKAAVRC